MDLTQLAMSFKESDTVRCVEKLPNISYHCLATIITVQISLSKLTYICSIVIMIYVAIIQSFLPIHSYISLYTITKCLQHKISS